MTGAPRRLGRVDRAAAVDVLVEAFALDPLFVRLVGGDEPGARALVHAVVAMNQWSGGLRWGVDAPGPAGAGSSGQPLVAAALVDRPRAGWTTARTGLAMLRFLPAALALAPASVRLFNRYGAAARGAAPAAPHHYLTMVGVRPAHQGRGAATALLTAVAKAADADPASTGVALDTENEENVALYQRQGFVLTSRQLVDDLPVYSMFRPGRGR